MSSPQYRRRVCSRGRRRGHLQDVHHPSEEREASGGGGGDYPSSSWNQARDLVGACRQLLRCLRGSVAAACMVTAQQLAAGDLS